VSRRDGRPRLTEAQLRTFDEVGAVTLDALGDRDHPLFRALEARYNIYHTYI
jgi:hypothetical protein